MYRKTFYDEQERCRWRSRPRKRWIGYVKDDLKRMEVGRQRTKADDREEETVDVCRPWPYKR